MHPLAGISVVDAKTLEAKFPELVLRPGMMLAARVHANEQGRGQLSLAGRLLAAQLPEELAAGEQLKLQVQEATPERVVLRIEPPVVPMTPQAALVPLPDGRLARVEVSEREAREGGDGQGGAGGVVALSYETEALGRLDLRLELGPHGITATIAAPARSFALADDASGALARVLAETTHRDASVRVLARRDPFDAYA